MQVSHKKLIDMVCIYNVVHLHLRHLFQQGFSSLRQIQLATPQKTFAITDVYYYSNDVDMEIKLFLHIVSTFRDTV